jgi:hypothetical protein
MSGTNAVTMGRVCWRLYQSEDPRETYAAAVLAGVLVVMLFWSYYRATRGEGRV